MRPSTGAAVRLHRNAVRDRPDSLSAFKWNACPPSPESALGPMIARSSVSVRRLWPLALAKTFKSGTVLTSHTTRLGMAVILLTK